MSNSNDTGKLIGAALLGVGVGAVIGILLAPDKGSETRKKLLKGMKDLAEDLQETFKESVQEPAAETAPEETVAS